MRFRRRIATAAVASAAAVAVTLALAACGGGVKNSGKTTSANTGTTQPVAGGEVTTPTETSTGSSATGTTDASGPVLAQRTVRVPGSATATVDIAVTGLAVQDKLATLTARFTPHFPDEASDKSFSLYDMSDNALDTNQVSLVDPVGLKRYLVVEDANRNPLGSDEVNTEAMNNSPVVAHWTFAAPPPNVTKIDVDLGPFPAFNDVPISR